MLERLEQMEQKLVLALARLCYGLSRKAMGVKGQMLITDSSCPD